MTFLSEIIDENNVGVCGVPLCVQDGPFVWRDGQSGGLPGRAVFQIEDAANAMSGDVVESDAGFRGGVEEINAVLDYRPITPETRFQRTDELNLFAAISWNAP